MVRINRCRPRPRRLGAVAGLALACACLAPASAPAATVTAETDEDRITVRTIHFTAKPGEVNNLSVQIKGDFEYLSDTGPVTAGTGCSQVTPKSARCSYGADVSVLDVHLGDRGDTLAPAPKGVDGVIADGGPGDDVVYGTEDTEASIGDTLAGGPGRDVLHGLSGPDQFEEGSDDASGDLIDGGPGGDAVDYSGRSAPVAVTLNRRDDDGAAGERDALRGIEDLTGGKGDDILIGDGGINDISGGPGGDAIDGRGGGDLIFADDVTASAQGDDKVAGGPGDDTIFGGGGNDVLDGGRGRDTLEGEAGNDGLVGGPGQDALLGGPGDDVIPARDGSFDEIACGSGKDAVDVNRSDLTYGGEFGRCEKLKRRGVPVAVPAGTSTEDSFILSVDVTDGGGLTEVGCPSDMGHRCRGRLSMSRKGRRIASRRFNIKPGTSKELTLKLSKRFTRRVYRRGRKGLHVTVSARARDGRGYLHTTRFRELAR